MPRKATIPSSAKPTVKPKKSPVKTTPVQKTLPAVEKVVPIDTPVSPRPRPSAAELSNLARRVMQRQQETAAPGNRVDGFGKPIEAPPTAVEITVKYSDGTVTSAVGKVAEVMVKFSEECQVQAVGRGLAYYGGPEMTKYTKDEWEAHIAG